MFFTCSYCYGNLDKEVSLIDKQKSISSASQLQKLLGDKCRNGSFFKCIRHIKYISKCYTHSCCFFLFFSQYFIVFYLLLVFSFFIMFIKFFRWVTPLNMLLFLSTWSSIHFSQSTETCSNLKFSMITNKMKLPHVTLHLCYSKRIVLSKYWTPNCLFIHHTHPSHPLSMFWIKQSICFNHGTKIQTGITCRKIPCYMRDSARRWLIVHHFLILASMIKCRILIGLCK